MIAVAIAMLLLSGAALGFIARDLLGRLTVYRSGGALGEPLDPTVTQEASS